MRRRGDVVAACDFNDRTASRQANRRFSAHARFFDLCLSEVFRLGIPSNKGDSHMGSATLPILLSVMGFLALLLLYFMWARKVGQKK